MIPDAEVLSVVCQILTGLGIGSFKIKVNHRKFLDAMIELSGCEKRKFKSICSSVDKLDKEPWEKVELELINQKGLTKEMTTNLRRFVQFTGEPWELLKEIKDSWILHLRLVIVVADVVVVVVGAQERVVTLSSKRD